MNEHFGADDDKFEKLDLIDLFDPTTSENLQRISKVILFLFR